MFIDLVSSKSFGWKGFCTKRLHDCQQTSLWSSGQSVIKMWSRIKTWHFCLHDELLLCHFMKFHPSCQCYFNSSSPAQTYVSIVYVLITWCFVCILPLLAGFAAEKKDTNQWTFDPFQWILSHWIKFQTKQATFNDMLQMYVFFWYLPLKLAQCVLFTVLWGYNRDVKKYVCTHFYFTLEQMAAWTAGASQTQRRKRSDHVDPPHLHLLALS